MTEPWKTKEDDTRVADSLITFIIFCEDDATEPIYFQYFETSLIKVNPVPGQKSKIHNVVNAITHCIDQKMMDKVENELVLKDVDTQVWCVFDFDTAEVQNGKEKVSFDEAIKMAQRRGIKVAWSNDCFELWILLHFEEIDPQNTEYKTRSKYYDALTELFRKLPKPNQDLVKALAYHNFNYKANLKSKNNFRSVVRSEIVKKTDLAISRSKSLEAFHEKTNKPHHEWAPCTLVHHLVEELIRTGKKGYK